MVSDAHGCFVILAFDLSVEIINRDISNFKFNYGI